MTFIDIGGDPADRNIVREFYQPESSPPDTLLPYTYRWSTPTASLVFPAHYLPAIIEIWGSMPPDGTRIDLQLADRVSVALPVHTDSAVRRYHLLWPDSADALGWAHIRINADLPEERVEERRLGMFVADARIVSVETPGRLPPLPLLLLLTALPIMLALCLRLSGIGELVSSAAGVIIGSGGVLIWGWQPWWIQQFLLHCFFALLALALVLWWTRRVITLPITHDNQVQLPDFLLVLVVTSGLIPLYLLLKYGLDLWLHPANLPIAAMAAALPLPFVRGHARSVLIGVVVVALVSYGLDRFAGAVSKDYATDFTAMFRGVRSFVSGDDLYNLEHIRANHLGDNYKYPPFFVFLMAPITGLPYTQAILCWHLFNLALLLIAAYMLWRWSGQPMVAWSTLGLGYMLLTFKPVVDTLSNGQTDIIMLVCLSAALLALKHQRWGVWGILLAIPTVIKLYPAYLLIHGLALRQWRGIAACCGAGLLLVGVAIAGLGWQIHATFLYEVLPAMGGGTAWVENQTLNGFLNRLTVSQIGLTPDEPGLLRWLGYAGALLLSGWTFMRVQRMPPDTGFGLWIVTLLIILPIAWMHYQAVLLIPFYQLFVRIEQQSTQPVSELLNWRSLLLYALAWMLLCYGNQWTFFDRTMEHGPLWVLTLSYKLYGLLLLWLALAYDPTARYIPIAQRQPEQPSPAPPAVLLSQIPHKE